MKRVEWVDEQGRRRCRLVQDVTDDPMEGIPLEPPDVDRLDWEAIATALHNQLMNRGLLDITSVERRANDVQGAIFATLRRPLLDLYRERPNRGE